MASRRSFKSISAKVAQDKENHPEKYCPVGGCLWCTGDGRRCPRHVGGFECSEPEFCSAASVAADGKRLDGYAPPCFKD